MHFSNKSSTFKLRLRLLLSSGMDTLTNSDRNMFYSWGEIDFWDTNWAETDVNPIIVSISIIRVILWTQ